MRISRRNFAAYAASFSALPMLPGSTFAAEFGRPLPIPDVVDVKNDTATIDAIAGETKFLPRFATPTVGFNQSFLGPVLRFSRGSNARMRVVNRLGFPITSHWHGLHVPTVLDGGPKIEIAPGAIWAPELPIDQPAGTLWYHSHIHGRTANHVYAGLAGMIIVDDPAAPDPGLPNRYGIDDLPFIVQDRVFGRDGAFYYIKRGPSLMHGFRGDSILVNGAIRPQANVPAGLVRLRVLNGSNARIYHFRFADGRKFHQVASDAGLLPAPVEMKSLRLAPAERAEIVVDFGDAKAVSLTSDADRNNPMGGMMGRFRSEAPPQFEGAPRGFFEVARFVPDRKKAAERKSLPSKIAGAPKLSLGESARRRRFVLDMHVGPMGPGMMMRGGRDGGPTDIMGINGRSFDMDRVDTEMRLGETELWQIESNEMAHPFHVHGTSFQVVSMNGKKVPYNTMGLKDVLLVDGRAEILLRVDHIAKRDIPFMYHCHILEHEDAGMMGQFSVT